MFYIFFVTMQACMSNGEKISVSQLSVVCYNVQRAIRKVAIRAHHEYAFLLQDKEDARPINLRPNIFVSQKTSIPMMVVFTSLGGRISTMPTMVIGHASTYTHDSRFIEATAIDLDSSEEICVSSAKITAVDGAVVFNGKKYHPSPSLLLLPKKKEAKVNEIGIRARNGLAVAEFVERNVALSTGNEPQMDELHAAYESLPRAIKEIPLEENVEVLLSVFKE